VLYIKRLEISSVSQVLSEQTGVNLVLKHARLNMQPPVLKKAAQDAYDLWSAAQKNDISEAASAWKVLARQTAAAWQNSGNKRNREDKLAAVRRDAARDQTSEAQGRKKASNELRAAKRKQPKQRKDGARTGARPSSESKNTAAMVSYGCIAKGNALRECTKVEENAKKSIMDGKFQEWKNERMEKDDKNKIGSLAQVQGRTETMFMR
jgi:hypothetical protein